MFFAHSMGGDVHAPVPIMYGDRVVPTAVAAADSVVVVAFEDPNSERAYRSSLAMSAHVGPHLCLARERPEASRWYPAACPLSRCASNSWRWAWHG